MLEMPTESDVNRPDPTEASDEAERRLRAFLAKRWRCDCFLVDDDVVWKDYVRLLTEWVPELGSWRSALRRAEALALRTGDIRPGKWGAA